MQLLHYPLYGFVYQITQLLRYPLHGFGIYLIILNIPFCGHLKTSSMCRFSHIFHTGKQINPCVALIHDWLNCLHPCTSFHIQDRSNPLVYEKFLYVFLMFWHCQSVPYPCSLDDYTQEPPQYHDFHTNALF